MPRNTPISAKCIGHSDHRGLEFYGRYVWGLYYKTCLSELTAEEDHKDLLREQGKGM